MSSLVLFVPIDAYGHINACIGIGQKLVALGHNVVFALEQAWAGKLSKFGFKEQLYIDTTRDPNIGPNEHWIKSMSLIEDTLSKDSLYKAGHQNIQEFEEFIFNELNFDCQLEQIIAELKPDVIVVDNYFSVPAVFKSGCKWIQMTSANPLSAISHPDTPPSGSGYPTNGDKAQWKLFEDTFMNHYGPVINKFAQRIASLGLPSLPNGALFHPSPYLNIYAYPEELDYLDIRPLPDKWQRYDHFIRNAQQNNSQFVIPEKLTRLEGKLVYVSMGSMGCADRRLMERLISILGTAPHRFIMVLGPHHDKLKLADNIWGERMLPQVEILPKVDLVITHGGNNSVLESLYHGKPMIINPLFADQYDNAQRVTEKQFGYRVNAYECEPAELLNLIELVLNDQRMQARCAAVAKRLQSSNSTEKAAQHIIQIARTGHISDGKQ